MFEKWFGGKNKVEGVNSDKNSVGGVAHFDGTKTEKDLLQSDNDFLEEGFDNIDSSQRVSTLRKRDVEKFGTNWKELSTKVSNERKKEKLGERNSGLGNEDLTDEPKRLNPEDILETIAEDDSDLEQAA